MTAEKEGGHLAHKDDRYEQAIDGRKIPILTLDQKWHRLFTQTGVSAEIKRKEEKVNELLKKQGGLQTRQKDIKRLKNKLMQEVLSSMEGEEKPKGRSKEENGKLIEECNEKLEEGGEALLEVEKKLEKENRELMVLSMEVCYDLLQENGKQIEEIDAWINQMRIELKKNVVRKQQKELYNQELYSYMHDIFGPDVMELFDLKYQPKLKATEKEDGGGKKK